MLLSAIIGGASLLFIDILCTIVIIADPSLSMLQVIKSKINIHNKI